MPPKEMSQAAIERLITQRVNAVVEAEHARQCNPTAFHGHDGAIKLRGWFEKTKMLFGISECAEGKKVKFAAATLQGRALTWWNSQEMVPTECKKIEAYIRGLTDNIKGKAISSRPTSLNEAVRMAHALMEQKAQARAERITEGNKRKWENSQGGNNSNNRNNNMDNTRHNQQNNHRQEPEPSMNDKLQMLHMDICGSMRV
ncbi:hypothetical protein Tco_0109379 [Tanacetum coccineum]